MKYVFWIIAGIICGAALGLVLPIATGLFFDWLSGDPANGVGTFFALVLIATVPIGALLGAFVGFLRAMTGHFSPSSIVNIHSITKVLTQKRRFQKLNQEIAALPNDEALLLKEKHLRNLNDDYNSIQWDKNVIIVWLILSLLVPLVFVVPLVWAVFHFWVQNAMQKHIQYAMDTWSEDMHLGESLEQPTA